MIDDGLDVAAALFIHRDLPIGAGALLEDLVGVLDVLSATELIYLVSDDPVDVLTD